MQTATLGGLIKDFRIKKRLSQLEVSLRIGWKDTSRLSKIEQGRVSKPTRKTADKIISALNLTEQETGEFLLAGGYLPSDEEISKVINEISQKVDGWLYPSYVMDFSWRVIYCNKSNLKLFNLPDEWKDKIILEKPNVLAFPFLQKDKYDQVYKGEDEESLRPYAENQISNFRTENHRFQNESWYKKLINSLMGNDEFRKIWNQVETNIFTKKLYDYEYAKNIIYIDNTKKELNHHIFSSRLVNDPRFQIMFCIPADKVTEDFYK